jgi:hypothetical protein
VLAGPTHAHPLPSTHAASTVLAASKEATENMRGTTAAGDLMDVNGPRAGPAATCLLVRHLDHGVVALAQRLHGQPVPAVLLVQALGRLCRPGQQGRQTVHTAGPRLRR